MVLIQGWKTVRQPAFLFPLCVAMLAITFWSFLRGAVIIVTIVLAYLHWRFDLSDYGIRSRGWKGDLLAILFMGILGLLFGAVFNTVSAATAVEGIVILVYIIAGVFIGPLGKRLGSNSPVLQIARALPTYYIADGVYNAAQNLGSFGQNMLDIGVILGSTVVLLTISAWVLRRQSAVAVVI